MSRRNPRAFGPKSELDNIGNLWSRAAAAQIQVCQQCLPALNVEKSSRTKPLWSVRPLFIANALPVMCALVKLLASLSFAMDKAFVCIVTTSSMPPPWTASREWKLVQNVVGLFTVGNAELKRQLSSNFSYRTGFLEVFSRQYISQALYLPRHHSYKLQGCR